MTTNVANRSGQNRLNNFWKSQNKELLKALILHKALFFLVILISFLVFPWFSDGDYQKSRHWPLQGEPTWATRFATWDAAHYLYLAEYGYQKDDMACAFYPLWPAIIKAFSIFTRGNIFISGIVLANILSLAALMLFHHFVKMQHDSSTANLATLLLLAFPGAIFFSFIYTESLFLLLIVLFFIWTFEGNVWGTAVTGFLLALTKGIGVFCIVPLLWYSFLHRRPLRQVLVPYYSLILGYVSYFLIIYAFTGDALEGFKAQRYYPNHASIQNMFDVENIFRHLVRIDGFHDPLFSAVDRTFFLLFVVCLYPICRMNKTYFAYALFSGTVPALSIWFFSYSRHIMMCFPIFIVLAEMFRRPQMRLVKWLLLAVLIGVQFFFLIRHVNFIWAG